MLRFVTSPTKVDQYASAHANQEHVCLVETITKKKYRKAQNVLCCVCFVNVQLSLSVALLSQAKKSEGGTVQPS